MEDVAPAELIVSCTSGADAPGSEGGVGARALLRVRWMRCGFWYPVVAGGGPVGAIHINAVVCNFFQNSTQGPCLALAGLCCSFKGLP